MLHCQVQVTGPDSKAVKSKYNAFNVFRNGTTTLSSSGILACIPTSATTAAAAGADNPDLSSALVLAPVTCIIPFIQPSKRRQLASVTPEDQIPSVAIRVLVRLTDILPKQHKTCSSALVRLPARLRSVHRLPAVQAAAEQLLLSTNAASAGDWKLGWCLADQQPLAAATPAILSHVALLEVDLRPVQERIAGGPLAAPAPASNSGTAAGSCHGQVSTTSSSNGSTASCDTASNTSSSCTSGMSLQPAAVYQGQPVTISGSPFGCLAEQQFTGAVMSGCVSLLLPAAGEPAAAAAATAGPAAALQPSLFIVDARCMPGMEGGPVQCRQCGALLGVLGVPLSNSSSQAELLLVIPATHLLAALAETAQQHLQAICTTLQAASCCTCSSRSSGEPCSGADSSSYSGRLGPSSLHRQPAAAIDGVQQLQREQQQQQQEWQPQEPCGSQHHQQGRCNSSSSSSAPARRLQVHLQHFLHDGGGCKQQPLQQQQQQQSCVKPALTAASSLAVSTATCSADTISSTGSSSSGSAGQVHALQEAANGVVMVRVDQSWGTGVLLTRSGLVLTVAHLFRKTNSTHAAAAAPSAAAGPTAAAAMDPHQQQQQHTHDNSVHTSSSTGGGSRGHQAVEQQQHQGRDSIRSYNSRRLYPAPRHLLQQPAEPRVSIRLTVPDRGSFSRNQGDSSSSSSTSTRITDIWVPAKVVYCFTGYLDLAVLQFNPQSIRDLSPALLQPLQLVPPECGVTPGDDVYVIGHGLFGPRLGLAPAVTAGCAANVVSLPQDDPVGAAQGSSTGQGQSGQALQQQQQQEWYEGWVPSMVISTAAVHSGASGGALVDAAGRLVGLVTSNARHVRGQTLPHFNFCISAVELRPVWEWAQLQQQHWEQQQEQQQRRRDAVEQGQQQGLVLSDRAALQQLRALDAHTAAGGKLWALQPYAWQAVVSEGQQQ